MGHMPYALKMQAEPFSVSLAATIAVSDALDALDLMRENTPKGGSQRVGGDNMSSVFWWLNLVR